MSASQKVGKIISIVPRLPPAIDGVGDYALRLAQQMYEDTGVETHFVVGDPDWMTGDGMLDFPVSIVRERSATSFLEALESVEPEFSRKLLLHLSGYGYEKWSLYHWLVQGLTQWKRDNPQSLLTTIFHELYNPLSWPWSHRFWSSAAQKKLVIQIMQLSDRALTNCKQHSADITRLSRGQHTNTPVLPVFSNVGELLALPPMESRDRQLVVFGKSLNRRRAYQRSATNIEKACHVLGIKKIIDIGEPTGLDLSKFLTLDIVEIGAQSAEKISHILADSMVGWLSYESDRLEKSGVFAAYCSHGTIPIIESSQTFSELHYHFCLSSTHLAQKLLNDISINYLQTQSRQSFEWYRQHNIKVQTRSLVKIMELIQVSPF